MRKKRIFALCALMALCLSLLSACGSNDKGGQEDKKVDLAAFAKTVQEEHAFSSLERADPADAEMGELFQNALDNYYPGLTGLELEQMEIYLSMISFSGGELAMVQAKNADDATKVKEIFQARMDSKRTDGPGNYPEEVEMWQRSSKVTVNGNYVMLVNHEDCDAIVSEFNEMLK